MTTTTCPTSPHSRASNGRTSRPSHSAQPEAYAPGSQDTQSSAFSDGSNGSSIAPRLPSGDSNVSQISVYTDPTSPLSSADPKSAPMATRVPVRLQIKTPEERTGPSYFEREIALASPMSITSPVAATNGAKRTASGHVKNALSVSSSNLYAPSSARGEPRRDSISSTGSKAGELAASLKTRLGYAMAKVQNGWEHKSLDEVEQLAARRVSRHRHSVSLITQPVFANGVSNDASNTLSNGFLGHDGPERISSPPSKRLSANYSHRHRRGLSLGQHVQIQPATGFRSTPDSHVYNPPGILAAAASQAGYVNSMSPPQTPINSRARRPPTIRTETQTAADERDALQALSQLASPRTSAWSAIDQSHNHTPSQATSSSQASPFRSEFPTPRAVAFARSDSDSSGELPETNRDARHVAHVQRV